MARMIDAARDRATIINFSQWTVGGPQTSRKGYALQYAQEQRKSLDQMAREYFGERHRNWKSKMVRATIAPEGRGPILTRIAARTKLFARAQTLCLLLPRFLRVGSSQLDRPVMILCPSMTKYEERCQAAWSRVRTCGC